MLLAELDEMYARRFEHLGSAGARRWYREEVMAFVAQAPNRGLQRIQLGAGAWIVEGLSQMGLVLRGLRRAPGFSALAVLTLALGIGGNALIFAIADRAILRALPYPDADRLVAVLDGWTSSLGSIEILRRELSTVETLGAAWDAVGTTYEPEDAPAVRVSVAHVTPEYLLALGVVPTRGRLFRPEESRPGRNRVALLSSSFAQVLGQADGLVETTVMLEGSEHEVVGILPEGFDLPSDRNDIWIPAVVDNSPANMGLHWGMGVYSAIARMTPGVTPDQVRQDVLRVQETVRLANPLWTPPPNFWDDGRVTPLRKARGSMARTPLLLLMSAVGLVLLVVCANLANLLLSRGLTRRRDYAVRAALGAGTRRLATLQLAEVLVLALAGSVAGLGLAAVGLELIRPLLPPELPGAGQLAIDLRAVVFTVGLALVTGLVSGILPALRTAGKSPAGLLREEDRGRTGNRSKRRTTKVLVAGQMAVAVLLVTGASLLIRSLVHLAQVDPGFDPRSLVTARIDLPSGLPEDPEARALYFTQVHEALANSPELNGVALASSIPFGVEWESLAVFIPGVTDDPNNLPVVQQRRVSADYFRIQGIPLLAGRSLNQQDRVGSQAVALVDRTFAERFFPGEDPVGRAVRYPWRGATDILIVGVVGATFDGQLSGFPEPAVYFPLLQMGSGILEHAQVVVRSSGSADRAMAALQARIRRHDDRIAVSELTAYEDLLRDSLATQRLITLLLVLFAFTTLTLGAVGVYGVAAFSVRERFREIGVRMTLGADPAEIRNRVLGEGLRLALPGGILGLVLAGAGSRLLESFLFGVSTLDPLTFLAAPTVLLASALLAVYLPAVRATRVDPATVLREE